MGRAFLEIDAPAPPIWNARGNLCLNRSVLTLNIEAIRWTLSKHSPGWQVYIFPGPHFLRTDSDHVSAITKEEAWAKACAITELSPQLLNPFAFRFTDKLIFLKITG